jgi:hypothetical protein
LLDNTRQLRFQALLDWLHFVVQLAFYSAPNESRNNVADEIFAVD